MSDADIAAINRRNREGVARFQEANPMHRFKRAPTEDAMLCSDCGYRVTGEEIDASGYELRITAPCKAFR